MDLFKGVYSAGDTMAGYDTTVDRMARGRDGGWDGEEGERKKKRHAAKGDDRQAPDRGCTGRFMVDICGQF